MDLNALTEVGSYDAARVRLLEQVCASMYGQASEQSRRSADEMLRSIKAQPNAWQSVEAIFVHSVDMNCKFFGVSLLEDAIKVRWTLFSSEHKAAIKAYLVKQIVGLSTEDQVAAQNKPLLGKLNETLVQVVKNEWPTGWPDFIGEICQAARGNQCICENSLKILTILSQEVFERDSMTHRRAARLRATLSAEFGKIFELCMFVFRTHTDRPGAVKPSLISVALTTLQNFVMFIDHRYLFESEAIHVVISSFLEPPNSRVEALKCLTEVFSLVDLSPQHSTVYVSLFERLLHRLAVIIPAKIPIHQMFWEVVVSQCVVLFLNTLKSNPESILSSLSSEAFVYMAKQAVGFSQLPNEEIFKVTVELWLQLCVLLYNRKGKLSASDAPLMIQSPACIADPRLASVEEPLAELRKLLVLRMCKPPEVKITETEDGEIVKEDELDTDELALYRTMREVMVYLTNLNQVSMEKVLNETLTEASAQATTRSTLYLNRLCWAIGSISGALPEEKEKVFIVEVLHKLMLLCESKQKKEEKAVIACNLMYVISQYPRFLKAYHKFLVTLVKKLFEFFLEKFEGVQEMAVNTFLFIAIKCGKKMSILAPNEKDPFLAEILNRTPQLVKSIQDPLLMCTFYEGIAHVIAQAPAEFQQSSINILMRDLNLAWSEIIAKANTEGMIVLKELSVLRTLSIILRVNERLLCAVGHAALPQVEGTIYQQCLQVYKVYSETITQAVHISGHNINAYEQVKLMRRVKKDVLRLVATAVERTRKPEMVAALLDPVLGDYARSTAATKDAEVLLLLTAVAKHLTQALVPAIPTIFDLVFGNTLEMLKSDESSFPDHREAFFSLLLQVTRSCFGSLFLLSPQHLGLFMESLIFAMKHQHPKIAEVGGIALCELLEHIIKADADVARSFFSGYFFRLVDDVLGLLTDKLHKSGFFCHCKLLGLLIQTASRGALDTLLPKQTLMMRVYDSISSVSPTFSKPQLEAFTLNMFAKCENPQAFLLVIKDFLISVSEFADETDISTFEEEKQRAIEEMRASSVPGLCSQPPDSYYGDNIDDL